MSMSNDLMIVNDGNDLCEQIKALVTAHQTAKQYERVWDLVNDVIYDDDDYIRVREYRAHDDSYVELSADVLVTAVRLLRTDASVMSLVNHKRD